MDYINIKVPLFSTRESTIEKDMPIIIDNIPMGIMEDSRNGEVFGRFFRAVPEYKIDELDEDTNEIKSMRIVAVHLDIDVSNSGCVFKLVEE